MRISRYRQRGGKRENEKGGEARKNRAREGAFVLK